MRGTQGAPFILLLCLVLLNRPLFIVILRLLGSRLLSEAEIAVIVGDIQGFKGLDEGVRGDY